MKDRIIELLGRGIQAPAVALAVGCDESFISQIMSAPENVERVQALKAANFEKFTDLDDTLDQAEGLALSRVAQLIPFASRLGEAVAAYRVLNSAKRKTGGAADAITMSPSTIVNINLPESARVAMTMDANRQVIEVDGRPLLTMPSKNLANLLEARRATQLLEMQIPKTLEMQVTNLSKQL